MKRVTICFDQDGVIADWKKAMLAALGNTMSIDTLNKAEGRDAIIGNVYKEQPDFWATLPVLPEGLQMVKAVVDMVKASPYSEYVDFQLLTAVGSVYKDKPRAQVDKIDWFYANVEEVLGFEASAYNVVDHSCSKSDWLVEHTDHWARDGKIHPCNCLLVDDYKRNCHEWSINHGKAIQFVASDPEACISEIRNWLKAKGIV